MNSFSNEMRALVIEIDKIGNVLTDTVDSQIQADTPEIDLERMRQQIKKLNTDFVEVVAKVPDVSSLAA
jgi:hypothetical protein